MTNLVEKNFLVVCASYFLDLLLSVDADAVLATKRAPKLETKLIAALTDV